MTQTFRIHPIGVVRKASRETWIEVFPEYEEALLGLDDFSHAMVVFWFHKNDNPRERSTLRVHPRRDPKKPLTGVFATRSPARPNLIGISTCRVLGVEGNVVHIERIDADHDTPVVDIKPWIPAEDLVEDVVLPPWVNASKGD